MGILRLGGLVTGLDTDTIIAQLMALERRPVQLLQQKKSDLEMEQGAWKDIATRLSNLKAKVDELKAGAAAFSSGTATSSDNSVLKATGGVGAVPGSYTITVNSLAAAHSVASNALAATGALNISGSFTITTKDSAGNPVTARVDIQATDSLEVIRQKIADAHIANGERMPVTATIIQVSTSQARLVITSTRQGADSLLQFDNVDPANDVVGALGFSNSNNVIQAPNDAVFKIGTNVEIRRASNTISDVIPGVRLDLLQTGTATVTVSRDEDKAVAAIQALVDQYNSLAQFIAEKTGYDARTKQAGILLGDSSAASLMTKLRRNVLDTVAGLPADLQRADQVGLSTGTYASGNVNKLVLDTAKLRQKIEANPQGVADLFAGIADRLSETIDGYLRSGTGILSSKDASYQRQLDRLSKQIQAMEDRLALREQNLRRQFEALERAMQRLQSQRMSLLAQLAQLGVADQQPGQQ